LGQKNAALLLQGGSTVDQSCERQEREILAYAKRAQYNVIGVWKETASGGKDSRPERKQVMAMAQARLLSVLKFPFSEATRFDQTRKPAEVDSGPIR
jgi:putative DNA-invertase from lambdoid prophage Rac